MSNGPFCDGDVTISLCKMLNLSVAVQGYAILPIC